MAVKPVPSQVEKGRGLGVGLVTVKHCILRKQQEAAIPVYKFFLGVTFFGVLCTLLMMRFK